MLNRSLFSSETCQWETPRDLLADIERFLGDYFDPCPFTDGAFPAFDGLRVSWGSHVYCNPPYGRAIGRWTRKAIDEFRTGDTYEAILLLPARTDTAWMQPLLTFPICFIRGHLHFGGAGHGAPFPSALVYLGPRAEAFARAFAQWGVIVNG